MEQLFRSLPQIDEIKRMILREDPSMNEKDVTEAISQTIDSYRTKIKEQVITSPICNIQNRIKEESLIQLTLIKENKNKKNLRRVINGTGVILHTNLGRAPIAKAVLEEALTSLQGYSNLEYNLETGERGSRLSLVEDYLTALTGAESAVVVNNNAAAVLIALSALAKGGEVVISRGELIEIGGSFRVPEVMELSGSTLCEVGTTNKTHLRDYEKAITEDTKALLKVHTSNYRVIGFTKAVSGKELAELGQKYDLPTIEDLGSGVLVDLREYGLPHEPTVQEAVASGIDVVTFSGDKLLGGPQSGIIVGKKKYIDRIKSHPFYRAMRVDKFTFALLEETLRRYRDNGDITILELFQKQENDLKAVADDLRMRLLEGLTDQKDHFTIKTIKTKSIAGGGSLPETTFLSYGISIFGDQNFSANGFYNDLIAKTIPIVGRIEEGCYIIDVRTLLNDDVEIIVKEVLEILTNY